MLVQMAPYHTPVLLEESITGLNIRADGIYVDLTYGGGGHAEAILKVLKKGKLIAFDQDQDAIKKAGTHSKLILLNQNYRFLKNNLDYLNIAEVDGILADLGVSSYQFDNAARGFSFREEAPLDMRMNKQGRTTAADIVNEYSEQRLNQVLQDYAEIGNPQRFVQRIMEARKIRLIRTTGDLATLVREYFPGKLQHKILARIFQALRIEVNQELEALRDVLQQTCTLLRPGGRLVVISYHSLEDRMVKNFMREGCTYGMDKTPFQEPQKTFRLISKKVITPTAAEVAQNPRARSAKMRIAEKI